MNGTIKLNPVIEGVEVRDAAKWLKHILGDYLNKMKIGRKGFLFSFIDSQHIIAGKVFIPSTGELWHSEKVVGFNCERLYNAFSIFKRKDKTELYIQEHRLFLKNGALKWRYEFENVEVAAKIDFSNIPTPVIRININDILPVKAINKGKRVSDKKGIIGFKYGGGKATMFVADADGKDRIDISEVATEGKGEGIALYNLLFLEKLLKDAKTGFMRIGEDKPAKLNIYTGKVTKALLYLAPLMNSNLTEEVRGSSPAPTEEEPQEEDKPKEEESEEYNLVTSENRVIKVKAIGNRDGEAFHIDKEGKIYNSKGEEVREGDEVKALKEREYEEAVDIKERKVVLVNFTCDSMPYKTKDGRGYKTWDLSFRTSFIEKVKKEEATKKDKWLKEEVAKDNLVIGKNKTEESGDVKQLKNDIKIDEETLAKAEKEKENLTPEAGEEVIFNADAPRMEEDIKQAKAELDKIQEQETVEHEKYLARINKAATDAAEDVEREKTEEAFKETEKAVKAWEDTYKSTTHKEIREEVVKEGISFLTVREANGAAFHNAKEVYEDMKAEAQIDRECMWVLHLVGSKVLKKELVAMGKGNAAYTTPREVYRRAIIEGATKIIMVHNHPSGDPEPSDADISTCEGYIKAGELLGIGLLDFLVIGTQGYTSFADKGIGGF